MVDIFSILFPVILFLTAAAMVVLRAGASRVFFDVVGAFQAERLISDVDAKMTVLNSLILDGLSGIGESITLISDQMQGLVDSTVPLSQEVAEARLEFEKFAANIDGAEALRHEIIAMGQEFGFTASQAMDAGSKMAQLGGLFGGAEAVGAATQAGLAFGMIGGLGTEDAMKRIIQLHQQTNALYGQYTQQQFLALTAEQQANIVRAESAKLLDQLNTVENRSAANMAQITHVMNQFASSGQLAGDSISYMAAMSATLIEAGEEQGKAGRALKMMYARLGADTGNNAALLQKFGVATKDANGNLRSMEDIVGDLSKVWPQMTDAQKLAVAQSIAGNDHYVRAIKLIENHARTTKLNVDAHNRLDSAVDEANKKLQDQAYLLKESEAALANSQAAIGDVLTPTVIRFNNEQARMNNALADLAGTDVGGAFVDAAYYVQTYFRMYAPLGEILMNTMSLNISLQTQSAIMRAISHQDVVRAAAYGGRAQMGQVTLGQLSQELAMADQLAQLKMYDLSTSRAHLQVQDIRNNREFIFTSKKMNSIHQELAQKKILHADEINAREAIKMQQAHGHHMTQKSINNKVAEIQMLQQESALLDGLTTKEDVLVAKARERIQAGKFENLTKAYGGTLDEKAIQLAQEKKFLGYYENQSQEQANANATRQQQIEQQINTIIGSRVGLDHLVTGQGDKRIVQLNKEIMSLQGITNAELQHALAVHGTANAQGHQSRAMTFLNMMEQQGLALGAADVSMSQKQTELSRLAAVTATALAEAYGMEASQLMRIITQLPAYTAMQDTIIAKNQAQFQSQMSLNTALMASSMALGAISMVMTMVSDDADGARLAMILMFMSMVPMTIQMFTTMKSAYGAASGMLAFAAGTNTASVAVKGLRTALITTGIGALLVGVGYLIDYMIDWGDETDNTTSSLDEMGSAVNYTKEQFDAWTQTIEENNMSIEDIYATQQEKIAQIKDLEKELENATDSTNRKLIEGRLKLRREEVGLLNDILASETTMALLAPGSETLAKNIFDAGQEYRKGSDALQAAVDEATKQEDRSWYEGFMPGGDSPELFSDIGEWFQFEENERVGKAIKDQEEGMADLEQMIAESVPDAYQHFVLEQAKAADSFEDFMQRLRDTYGIEGMATIFGNVLEDNVIGPIEAAKEAAFEFANAREEMFFGAAAGNITSDMIKQVVNKGVETLISTTEVIQTNNFNGMTTKQAADAIVTQIEQGLTERGIALEQ